MTTDDNRESLADAAAAWVPPWDRPKPPPATPAEPAEAEAAPAEPEPVTTPAEPEPEPEPVAAAAEPEATAEPVPAVENPTAQAAEGTDARVQDAAPEVGSPSVSENGPPSAPAVPSQKGPHRAAEPAAADGTAPAAAAAPKRRRAKAAPKEPEPDPVSLIDDAELRGALEAILLVVDEPVAEVMLSQVLEQPTERVTQMLYLLAGEYTDRGHGFDLRRVAGGWRLYTRPEYAAYVERFVLDGQTARLTQAALETLAVVAYKQPCSRSQVSAIRGVNCDGVMRTLVTRGLVEDCGADTSGAYLYKTTTLFLEKLGIDSVAQLPPLAPFLPDNVEEIVIDA